MDNFSESYSSFFNQKDVKCSLQERQQRIDDAVKQTKIDDRNDNERSLYPRINPQLLQATQHRNSILKAITCQICKFLIYDPVQCSGNCESTIFCKLCVTNLINQSFPCPKKCQGEQTRLQTKNLSPEAMSDLKQTQIKCKNSGCNVISYYQDAITHAYQCQVKPYCKKCGELFKDSKELHELRDCVDSLFNCKNCDETFKLNSFVEEEKQQILKHECIKRMNQKILSENDRIQQIESKLQQLQVQNDQIFDKFSMQIESLNQKIQQQDRLLAKNDSDILSQNQKIAQLEITIENQALKQKQLQNLLLKNQEKDLISKQNDSNPSSKKCKIQINNWQNLNDFGKVQQTPPRNSNRDANKFEFSEHFNQNEYNSGCQTSRTGLQPNRKLPNLPRQSQDFSQGGIFENNNRQGQYQNVQNSMTIQFMRFQLPVSITGIRNKESQINREMINKLDQFYVQNLQFNPSEQYDLTIQAETILMGLFEIQIVQNSIINETGAITNCVGNDLELNGRVSAAIKEEGGIQIEQECKQWVKNHGKVPTGCCAVTQKGNLSCSYIIHTIGPRYDKNTEQKSLDLLSSCVINTLECANILQVESVSIPAISSGGLDFPKDKCAKIMIKRIAQWFALKKQQADAIEPIYQLDTQTALYQVTRLKKVRICDTNDETVKCFVTELNKVYGNNY